MKHKKRPDEYCEHIFDQINLFDSDGAQHVFNKSGLDYYSKCLVLKVKARGRSVVIWGCMSEKALTGVEEIFIDGTMNACGCTKTLAEKMTPSLETLGRR